uniref:hypothetical protein n=1 Tax=Microbulbifer litoralis TaxID=2933965 RepID=UPI0020280012
MQAIKKSSFGCFFCALPIHGKHEHDPANDTGYVFNPLTELDRSGNQLLVENFKDRENEEQPLTVELLAIDLETGNRESLLSWKQRKNERMVVVPVIDNHTEAVYLNQPNLGMAIFDPDSHQYL